MKSHITQRFRDGFAALPEPVQHQARSAYGHFEENPWHASLHFKRIHTARHIRIYSVRIGNAYRAIGERDEDGITWFWIGSHADYDRLIGQF